MEPLTLRSGDTLVVPSKSERAGAGYPPSERRRLPHPRVPRETALASTGLSTKRWSPAFLISAVLLWLPLFLAEASWRSGIGDSSLRNQLDNQVVMMQGNLLRQLCYLSAGLFGFLCLLRGRRQQIEWRNAISAVFGSLLVWCALSIFSADDSFSCFKRLISYACIVLAAAGISVLWTEKQRLQVLSVGGTLAIAIGVLKEVSYGEFRPWSSFYRFSGTLPDYFNTQGFCCLFLALCSLAAADADRQHRTLFRIFALIGAVFMVLTRSRSSLLGFAVGALIYVLVTQSLRTKVFIALASSIVVLILDMAGVVEPVMHYLSRNGEGAGDFNGRTEVWALLGKYADQRPLAGFGFGAFWSTERIDYLAHEFHWKASSAHNGFLEVRLGLGYVGLVLYVLTLVLGMYFGYRLYQRTKSPIYALTCSVFAALLAISTFESAGLTSVGPYNFDLLLLVAGLCLRRKPELAPGTERCLAAAMGSFPARTADKRVARAMSRSTGKV